jgi:predicted ATP-binding protein involved in virulence
MDENRDLVVRRITAQINALRAKTIANGCTEEEAMLAAAKAGELMAKYRLSQTDLEIEAEPIDQRHVDRRQAQKEVSEDNCLQGIQRYCGVKCWYSWTWKQGKVRQLVIFGKRADCDHAEWLYQMIGPTIMRAAEGYKTATKGDFHSLTERRQAVLDFRVGMALRINARLLDMARELEPTATTASGTALVPLRRAMIDEAFRKLDLNLRRGGHGRNVRQGDAFARGAAEGDRVSLTRPVGRTSRGTLPRA